MSYLSRLEVLERGRHHLIALVRLVEQGLVLSPQAISQQSREDGEGEGQGAEGEGKGKGERERERERERARARSRPRSLLM